MKTSIYSTAARPHSLRRFIAWWASAIVVAFLLLCGGFMYAIAKQHAKTNLIFSDSMALQINHAFESAVLAEARHDLLWQDSGDSKHQVAKLDTLRNSDQLLTQFRVHANSPEEVVLVQEIESDYAVFRSAASTSSRTSKALQTSLEKLLQPLYKHRAFNERQMKTTLQAANNIDRTVDTLAITLITASMLLVIVGSIELYRRIFRPTLQLSQAAQLLGTGDLQARAPVLRDDELGQLCRTFNAMAQVMSEREKERLQFVATVAHDLRNPLVIIGGAAHLLCNKRERLSPEEQNEWLDNIVRNARKLESMIGDLMDGVQAETGNLSFQMGLLDLAELARDVTQQHEATTQTHLIRFECESPCFIFGDHKRLERVLMNLLSNAIKYSPGGSEVTVKLKTVETSAILTVRDEGAGIAPEDLPKLFQPFSRLEHTKEMAPGTGLGLTSVKKIVEGHGGVIRIESAPGEGTTFEVSMPLNGDIS